MRLKQDPTLPVPVLFSASLCFVWFFLRPLMCNLAVCSALLPFPLNCLSAAFSSSQIPSALLPPYLPSFSPSSSSSSSPSHSIHSPPTVLYYLLTCVTPPRALIFICSFLSQSLSPALFSAQRSIIFLYLEMLGNAVCWHQPVNLKHVCLLPDTQVMTALWDSQGGLSD